MRRRRFGTTDLETSAVGFGTWALGSDWWGEHESPDALVARALALGVTFFDTGDTYGQGLNEELVGAALARAGAARDRYELSTKFGYVLDADRKAHKESERPHDWSPAHTRRALGASLRVVRHRASLIGGYATLSLFPERGLAIAAMSNGQNALIDGLALQIAQRVAIVERWPAVPKPR